MKVRRRLGLCIACLAGVVVLGGAGLALAARNSLYECDYCHQQYQGSSTPPRGKCPAKDLKEGHSWTWKRDLD